MRQQLDRQPHKQPHKNQFTPALPVTDSHRQSQNMMEQLQQLNLANARVTCRLSLPYSLSCLSFSLSSFSCFRGGILVTFVLDSICATIHDAQ